MALPPYEKYPPYQEKDSIVDTIGLWLAGVACVCFLGLVLFHLLTSIGERYGGSAVAVTILVCTGMPLVFLVVRGLLKWYDSWLFDPPLLSGETTAYSCNKGNTTNNTTYTPPKPVKAKTIFSFAKRSYLLAGERKSAPRATFFGRIDGKDVQGTGLYEEQWLNSFEFDSWVAQKERTEAYDAGLVSKTIKKDELVINTTTKVDF